MGSLTENLQDQHAEQTKQCLYETSALYLTGRMADVIVIIYALFSLCIVVGFQPILAQTGQLSILAFKPFLKHGCQHGKLIDSTNILKNHI